MPLVIGAFAKPGGENDPKCAARLYVTTSRGKMKKKLKSSKMLSDMDRSGP